MQVSETLFNNQYIRDIWQFFLKLDFILSQEKECLHNLI